MVLRPGIFALLALAAISSRLFAQEPTPAAPYGEQRQEQGEEQYDGGPPEGDEDYATQTPAQDTVAKPAVSALINLNSANAAELEKLPGVGPAMATRILEYRQKSGGFKKIEELMNVKGIGEKSFLKLKPMLVVTAKPEKTGGDD